MRFAVLGTLTAAALQCSRHASKRQGCTGRRFGPVEQVTKAEEVALGDTSEPGKVNEAEEKEAPSREKKGFAWFGKPRNRDEDLLEEVAAERTKGKMLRAQLELKNAERVAKLSALHKQLGEAQEREAALMARLKQAKENKMEMEQKAKVLEEQYQAISAENSRLAPIIAEQQHLLKQIMAVVERLNRREEDLKADLIKCRKENKQIEDDLLVTERMCMGYFTKRRHDARSLVREGYQNAWGDEALQA